jgi:hypothetical protein
MQSEFTAVRVATNCRRSERRVVKEHRFPLLRILGKMNDPQTPFGKSVSRDLFSKVTSYKCGRRDYKRKLLAIGVARKKSLNLLFFCSRAKQTNSFSPDFTRRVDNRAFVSTTCKHAMNGPFISYWARSHQFENWMML